MPSLDRDNWGRWVLETKYLTIVVSTCNNNNMHNPSLHLILWGYACCHCCMQLSLVCIHEFFVGVNSELRTIYVSSVWSFHNQLFTMHHLSYYPVSLIFGTTIPTSFNILVKCFFILIWKQNSCNSICKRLIVNRGKSPSQNPPTTAPTVGPIL